MHFALVIAKNIDAIYMMQLDHAIKIHFFPEAAISCLQNQRLQLKKNHKTPPPLDYRH